MQKPTTPCYLRKHRLHWGLSIREVSKLMGLKDSAHLARMEKGKAPPTLRAALACQVIYNVSPAEMFPHAYGAAEDRIMGNMGRMYLALEKSGSDRSRLKRKLFREALERVAPSETHA